MGRRHDGANDSKRFYDWLDCAADDLRAAELLLEEEETLSAAAFHCQQCIEKALKGYILFKTHSHVDGHNLTWLCRQAVKIDRRFLEWLDESAVLNRFYIETRYPADIPLELSTGYVRRVWKMAGTMYRFINAEIVEAAER